MRWWVVGTLAAKPARKHRRAVTGAHDRWKHQYPSTSKEADVEHESYLLQ